MIFHTCLIPGEAGDDRREGVHVGFEDDVVGDAPALPARMEIFHAISAFPGTLLQRREQFFHGGGQVSPNKQVINTHNPVEVVWDDRPEISTNRYIRCNRRAQCHPSLFFMRMPPHDYRHNNIVSVAVWAIYVSF